MSFSSLEVLQFGELRELVSSFAGSMGGQELLAAIEPHSDRAQLELELAEAGQAIAYLTDNSSTQPVQFRFDQIRDTEASIRTLQVTGARLEGRQILDLFRNLELAGEYQRALLAMRDQFPLLAGYGDRLADLRPIARRWNGAFLPDGSLADHASPALARIRREMEKQKRSIQESLQRFLRAHKTDGTLQEEFVTVREDRYVVPVVAGQRGRVDGVIHGSSGTGRTLFIEPLETIGLNNELIRLREDEIREVQRILLEITDELREHQEEIETTSQTLSELDALFAKANFAAEYRAVIPSFSGEERRLRLREARHPLLETVLRKARRRIVPISFELDDSRRCLLISGPNTGGKTVTMKTAGLLALMAHAGLPVPCSEAEFPLFDDVLADIGDSQSIEESLSSFSGHLLHVKKMLADVTAESLVLLDELGRATDPEEGGALGVAVLDEFRKSGAMCLASTHLLPLKLYGTKTPNVLNASMGFDEATLQPTYELRLGLPGKSAGLDIATRLGMPTEVLQHARSVLPRLQADFQDLLADLQSRLAEAERRTKELAEATESFRLKQAQLETETARKEQVRQRDWVRKREELVADFEARALLTINKLPELAEDKRSAEQARRLVAQTRREFNEEAAPAMAPPPELKASVEPPKPVIQEGVRVRVRDIREPATVRRILKNGTLEVEAGLLRMQIAPEDVLDVVTGKDTTRKLPVNVRVETGPRWDVSYRELNLIGQRAEEAVDQLDKFLDSAALASVNRIRVVHGHGMGVLKRAVSEYLQGSPHVARFYPATPAEGGSGATVVELRD